jgi:hypothetical protein
MLFESAKLAGLDPHRYVLEATRRAIASPDTATSAGTADAVTRRSPQVRIRLAENTPATSTSTRAATTIPPPIPAHRSHPDGCFDVLGVAWGSRNSIAIR